MTDENDTDVTIEWENAAHPADRTVTFHDHGTDEVALAAVCAARCRRCARFIAWVWDHPKAGHVVIRRVPLDLQENHPLSGSVDLVRTRGGGNVKPDLDSELHQLGQLDEFPAWCVECRGWRTFTQRAMRAALAVDQQSIRV